MRIGRGKWLLRIVAIAVLISALCYASFVIYLSYQDCPFWLRNELARSGYRLSFTSNRDGKYETYIMNADGSNALKHSDNPAENATLIVSPDLEVQQVSPDGQHIALEDNGLWITDREMIKQQRLVHPAVRVTGFSWSPDGRFLAIAEGVLTVADIESQKTRSLSDMGFIGVAGVPRWSANGKYIAFEIYPLRGRDAREAGLQNWEVYILDVNTFQPCLLTVSAAYSDNDPAWLTNN